MATSNAVKRAIIGGVKYRTFRCIWMLEELGIPYLHIPATPHSPEVLKWNPLGKVPVFVEEDGFCMYESAAINTFLGDKYRDRNPTLVPPAGSNARGQYEQTLSVLVAELDSQGLWIHRKHESLGDIFTRIPEAVKHARKYFNKTNRSLIQQLKDCGPYLLGESFTAADIFFVHCLDWSSEIGWDDKWKSEEVVSRYLERCKARPAYANTHRMRVYEEHHAPKGHTADETSISNL